MDIGFGIVWHFIIDHHIDAFNIQAPCRHIGRQGNRLLFNRSLFFVLMQATQMGNTLLVQILNLSKGKSLFSYFSEDESSEESTRTLQVGAIRPTACQRQRRSGTILRKSRFKVAKWRVAVLSVGPLEERRTTARPLQIGRVNEAVAEERGRAV